MTADLSPDQAAAWRDVDNFMASRATEHAVAGPAGTGKTFLITRIVEAQRSLGRPIHLTATTNKAARVASAMSPDSDEARTIHRLLGLKPKDDPDRGKTILTRSREPEIEPRALVVVDEASMVQRELLAEIRSAAQAVAAKVLYVGDAYQLPPVFEMTAPVFDEVKGQSHLTQVHRQALENPLLATATEVRGVLDGAPFPRLIDRLNGTTGIATRSERNWTGAALSVFASADYQRDPDHCRMLGWTNRFVIEANQRIRRHLLGAIADRHPFLPGERFIVNSAVADKSDQLVLGTDTAVTIHGSQRGEVEGVPGWHLEVEAEDKSLATVFCPQDWSAASTLLSQLARPANLMQREANGYKQAGRVPPQDLEQDRKAAWRLFFDTKRMFADLRPPHACTVHKSQGSTFDLAFINVADIGKNTHTSHIARLLYVAMTRPRHLAFMTGELPSRLYREVAA